MNATVAAQMSGADFLKLRKRRGNMIWVLGLVLVPLVILFVARIILHSSNPHTEAPAGGTAGFIDGLRFLSCCSARSPRS